MADKGYALRRWNGSAWQSHPLKRWSGSAWQRFALRQIGMPVGGGGGQIHPHHPGLVVNLQTIDAVKAKLADNDPWTTAMFADLGGTAAAVSGFRTTTAQRSFLDPAFNPAPLAAITDGLTVGQTGTSTSVNAYMTRFERMQQDGHAAWCNALAFAYTGTTRYATKVIQILDAWRTTMTSSTAIEITGPTRSGQVKQADGSTGLHNGKFIEAWCCSLFCRAAEIIRFLYTPWGEANAVQFGDWAQLVFLTQPNSMHHSNGANWQASFSDGRMQLAVYRQDQTAFDDACDYWRERVKGAFTISADRGDPAFPSTHIPIGTGQDPYYNTKARIDQLWYTQWGATAAPYVNGQGQETVRDIGHTLMSFPGFANAAETAWHQEVDLYNEEAQRITTAMEFHASMLLEYMAQYPSWASNTEPGGAWKPSNYPWPASTFEVGGNAWKLGWEILYNHYANRRGMNLPATAELVEQLFNNGFVVGNQAAWESLTHHGTGTAAPPVNEPPTASFTHSVSGRDVDVDGSASTDSDGTITSWAWNWGDGNITYGVTDSHTYAADGAYTVALTVTDDDGATSSAFAQITVSTATTFASDDFSDTVSNGWGSADVGGAWTVGGQVGTNIANDFDKASGVGTIFHQAGNTRRWAYIGSATVLDADIEATFSWDKLPNANSQRAFLVARRIDAANDYRLRLRIETNTVYMQLYRRVSNSETQIGTANIQIGTGAYTPNDKIRMRFRASGTNSTLLEAKAWEPPDPEPDDWQISEIDSTAVLQAAGHAGIDAYVTSSVTNTPTLSVDDFVVRTPAP